MTDKATQEMIDQSVIGKKGYLRNFAAYGIEPPKKNVPVVDGTPQPNAPAMTLPEYAAAKRWEKEVNGFELNGMFIATDDRSKLMISGARQAAESDAAFTTQWKTSDGFVTLDATTIIAISNTVLAHVSHCFAVEHTVLEAIEAGEITTTQEIDEAFSS